MFIALRCAISALLAVGALSGCTKVTYSFPGEQPDHVWQALVAIAETPAYYGDAEPEDRWIVRENAVWVDAPNARIEIYRELDRVLHRPATTPIREQRTWRFQIWYDPYDPPMATLISRGFAIPSHATEEAGWYFEDVSALLAAAGPFGPDPVAPPPPLPPPPEPVDETQPIIDVDELEPQ